VLSNQKAELVSDGKTKDATIQNQKKEIKKEKTLRVITGAIAVAIEVATILILL